MRYVNLKAEMIRRNLKNEDIAKLLEISVRSVRKRINEHSSDFKMEECKKIKNKFFPDCSVVYLFEDDTSEQEI